MSNSTIILGQVDPHAYVSSCVRPLRYGDSEVSKIAK